MIRSHIVRSSLAAMVALLVLAACEQSNPVREDYRLSHPVTVEKVTANLVIESAPGSGALAAADLPRLGKLARDYADRGEGLVEISVAATGEHDMAARALAEQVAAALVERGLPPGALSARLLVGSQAPLGSAVVTTRLYSAQAPECVDWSKNLLFDSSNRPSPNWGCSIQNNIAQMVVNPRDLIEARDRSASEAARASVIMEKYRTGAAMASSMENQATTLFPVPQVTFGK